MAALTITAANVRPGSNARTQIVRVGEAVTAGEPGYLKTSDKKYWLTDANAGSAEAEAKGVFLTNASADEYAVLQTAGTIIIGATVTKGEPYFVGATPGAIHPSADLASGWYTTEIGIASSTTEIDVDIKASGAVRA